MAAQDRVKINISVDVDDAKLDVLLAKLTALDSAAQSLERRFGKMATASRQMNENLRNTNKTLRYTNNEVKKVADKFDKAAKKIDATNKKLNDSNKVLQQHAKTTQQVNKQMDNHDKRNKRMRQSFGKFDMVLKRVVMQLGKFIMTLGKLTFIAVAGQLALFTAGLLTVKLALITGRAAVQIYQIALKGLSVTAAGVATALSVAAAAMREYNEAMLAPSMGGGLQGFQRASRLSRAAGSQNAGLLGGESTTAVVAALAKAGVSTGRVSPIARQLINLTGGDPAAVAAVAKTLGGGDFRAASSAVKGAAGFRADSLEGVTTMSQLLNEIQSGSVVSGAYANQSDLLAGTFIGTAKTQFAGLKDLFADMGQPLLGPFRDTMLDISQILRSNFIALGAVINKFGAESFAPTLTTMVEKTMDFVRMNIFDHLEDIEQMGENFVGFFRSVRDFFGDMANFLGEFEPAANVVIDMFGAMRGTGGGRSLFRQFSDLVVKNADGFKNFGASIGRVLGALFDALGSGQSGFFAKLPLFSDILDTIASDLIPGLAATMEGLMPILAALPSLLSQIGNLFEHTIAPTFKTLATMLGLVLGMPGGGLLGLGGFAMMKSGRARRGMMGMGGGFFSQRMQNINASRSAAGKGPLSFNGGMMLRGLVGVGLGVGGVNQSYQEGNMSGAATAAIGGALLGSVIPGLGTAVGAAAGAAVGTIASAVAARFGRDALREQRLGNLAGLSQNLRNLDFSTMRSGDLRSYRDILATTGASVLDFKNSNNFGRFTPMQAAAVITAVGGYKGRKLSSVMTEDIDATLGDMLFNPVGLGAFPGQEGDFDFTSQQLGTGSFIAGLERRQAQESGERYKRNFFNMVGALAKMEGVSVEDFAKQNFADGKMPTVLSDLSDFVKIVEESNFNEYLNEQAAATARAIEAMATLTKTLGGLSDEFGVSTDKIEELADSLGYNLQNGVTEFQKLVLKAFLQPIDRTQSFLPDFSTTPIGRAESNATLRATFTTFRDALRSDTVTSDMYRDTVEAFASFAVLEGVSPDVAGLAGISELYEQFGNNPLSGFTFFDQIHENLMPATEGILKRISAQYNIPYEELFNGLFVGGDTSNGFTNEGVSYLSNRVIKQEQNRRLAITSGAGLDPAQRLSKLQEMLSPEDYSAVMASLTAAGGGGNFFDSLPDLTGAEGNALINEAVIQASIATADQMHAEDQTNYLETLASAVDADGGGFKISQSSQDGLAQTLSPVLLEAVERAID